MLELLAPAGDEKNFLSAINCGADAVYLGLGDFSARKAAKNFNGENLAYYVSYAHALNVKVYVALNTLIKSSETEKFFSELNTAYQAGVDAVILQDVFLGRYIKENFKNLGLHLSTQAGINNVDGAEFALENGFDRVILARETNLKDVARISEIIETEVFVQGALCSSFSGHCYMSSFIGGNSGNRGLCKQPCRQKYDIDTKTESGKYSLSLSDLCLIEHLNDLQKAGVSSIKIEGRMRSPEYVAAATKAYRNALDGKNYDLSEIERTFNRGNYTLGYIYGQDENILSDKTQSHIGEACGKVIRVNNGEIVADKKFNDGDAFKLLRSGYEVGNAVLVNGVLKYSGDVKVGDEIRITKDFKLAERLLNVEYKKKPVYISGEFKIGKKGKLCSDNVVVETEKILESAKSAPLSEESVTINLSKTDIYPFLPVIKELTVENVFIPKSELNALRSKLYKELFYGVLNRESKTLKKLDFTEKDNDPNYENIVICDKFKDIGLKNTAFVFSPSNYDNLNLAEIDKIKKNYDAVYLYVPSFLSDSDKPIIETALKFFDGVYSDGINGLKIAEQSGKKVIAGIGLNIFNEFDIGYIKNEITADAVISQELSKQEIDKLKNHNFVFTEGSIKVMELLYCPFRRNCGNCHRKDIIKMTDEKGYNFYLRRIKINGKCRFEVYNGYKLSIPKGKYNVYNFIGDSEIEYRGKTAGNYDRGIK